MPEHASVRLTQALLKEVDVKSDMKRSRPTEAAFWPRELSPEAIGRRVIADLLGRKDFMLYDTGDVRALHYAEACAVFGAARLARLLKDDAILRRLAERYADEKLPPNTANHVDANVDGIIPLELFLGLGDRKYLARGLELADGQWRDPRPDGLTSQTRFWIDDVWMIGILQIEAWRATGNALYLERAANEIDAYVRQLQQANGLFFHGEHARFFWGRGNGWVAAGLAEILSVLPAAHPRRASLLAGFIKMMESLLHYQAADGMWRQLVDREDAWEETSGTAMFGYAIALGVKVGILPETQFAASYRKAWLALVDRVDEQGRVRDVCAGTWQQDNAEFYLNRPRVTGDFHGQAPLLWFAWCLVEMKNS
jgi:unsaturated rhamnogalacturonyl hydrolase